MSSGHRTTRSSSARNRPVSAIRPPAWIKTPAAAWMVKPERAAISAAPGVDRAGRAATGAYRPGTALPAAITRQTARTHLAACAAFAPYAKTADSTGATVEPQPFRAATKAADTIEGVMIPPRPASPPVESAAGLLAANESGGVSRRGNTAVKDDGPKRR